ncbi:hypothetical protein [Kordiimonas gwangyangensis]|uniref:hypothetical protein n=1 Tax=Kordiimonas gwangyangensis TaxID=288022 RepID=UPI000370A310|nr:hypothetical protein [Kordiimonas gwangyangensis]
MSIGRFILSVVVAFVIYAALYIGLMGVVFADIYTANAAMMRSPEEGLALFEMLGHLLQTIIVVALFNMAVGSNDVKAGARFGLLVGGYLAATDLSMYTGLTLNTSPLPYSVVIHMFVGAVIGMVLAKLYKPAGGGPEEA